MRKKEVMVIIVYFLIIREFSAAFNLTKENLEKVLVVVNRNRKRAHCIITEADM